MLMNLKKFIVFYNRLLQNFQSLKVLIVLGGKLLSMSDCLAVIRLIKHEVVLLECGPMRPRSQDLFGLPENSLSQVLVILLADISQLDCYFHPLVVTSLPLQRATLSLGSKLIKHAFGQPENRLKRLTSFFALGFRGVVLLGLVNIFLVFFEKDDLQGIHELIMDQQNNQEIQSLNINYMQLTSPSYTIKDLFKDTKSLSLLKTISKTQIRMMHKDNHKACIAKMMMIQNESCIQIKSANNNKQHNFAPHLILKQYKKWKQFLCFFRQFFILMPALVRCRNSIINNHSWQLARCCLPEFARSPPLAKLSPLLTPIDKPPAGPPCIQNGPCIILSGTFSLETPSDRVEISQRLFWRYCS